MKKKLLSLIILIGSLAAEATDYPYLTFELTDGTKASVSVTSLTLNVSGTTLTAGSESFTISNLNRMYFSETDESSSTGIKEIMNANLDETTDIYDLNGRKISKDQMRKGVYVVKTTSGTYKINVR